MVSIEGLDKADAAELVILEIKTRPGAVNAAPMQAIHEHGTRSALHDVLDKSMKANNE